MRDSSGLAAALVLALSLLLNPTAASAAGGTSHIRLTITDRAELDRLTRLVSIDAVTGHEVRAYASPSQLEALGRAGYTWELIPDARADRQINMCPPGWDLDPGRTWDCYPTYAQYTSLMQGFAANPLCQLYSIGASTNQSRPHDLWVVKISDEPDLEQDEPEVLYTSTMHGDEVTGYVLTLRLIDELLSGYGIDPELTALVDDLEIWINPVANPDGTYFGSDTSVVQATREYTTSGGGYTSVDPNRNFPDPAAGDHPDGNPWWAETQAMMAFAEAHSFVLAANFHGGVELVNYPWDTWARFHVDDAWLIDISRAYADQAQAASPPGYFTDQNNGITNGYAWYRITGGRQDYMTYWQGCREVTIELSPKMPDSSSLPSYWSYNRQALLDYLKQAREGIRGIVTNSIGDPLAATVKVVGHDSAADNSYVFSDPDVGDYHRMLLPGTYALRIKADGYITEEVSDVVVPSGDAVRVDVVLDQQALVTVAGQVTTPDARGPVAGATVEILAAPTAPAVTAGDGRYTIVDVPEDVYLFQVSADAFETIAVERWVLSGATTHDFVLAPLTVEYLADLEADSGGLVATPVSSGWEWGIPSGGGPPAHSGLRVWATNLDGDYAPGAHWYLDLPGITVPDDNPRLEFWHWYDIEQGFNDWDGGNLSISTNGGATWNLLIPDGGYPSDDVSALGEPGYTGSTGGWVRASFDLSAHAGDSAIIRWHFASDGSVQELGWYLDDIDVTGVSYAADFDFAPGLPEPGQTVQFSDRSSGPVQGWSWDFGDGGSSSEQNPTHVFTADNVYHVTLEASYGSSTEIRVRPVVVGSNLVIFLDDFESGNASTWSSVVGQ